MERIQLKDPGAELVMTVASVRPEVVERNNYYLFANGSKEMLVPQSSVEAQIERLGVSSVSDLVGKTIKFGRSTKMSRAGKPYWNLDLAEGGNGAVPPQAAPPASAGSPSASAGAAGAAPSAPKSYTDLYLKAMDFGINVAGPKYKAAGLNLSVSELVGVVATVFEAKVRES